MPNASKALHLEMSCSSIYLSIHIDIGDVYVYVCMIVYAYICQCIRICIHSCIHIIHICRLILHTSMHIYIHYIYIYMCKTNIHGIFIRYSWDLPFSTFSMSIFAQHRVDRPRKPAQAPPKATPKPPASLEFWSVTWDETLEPAGEFPQDGHIKSHQLWGRKMVSWVYYGLIWFTMDGSFEIDNLDFPWLKHLDLPALVGGHLRMCWKRGKNGSFLHHG